jgi:signal transduction histidine kinase
VTDPSPFHRWRHDLRNQLGIVLGFAELLLNDIDPTSPHRADLIEIHTAATRALELAGNMPDSPDEPRVKDPA